MNQVCPREQMLWPGSQVSWGLGSHCGWLRSHGTAEPPSGTGSWHLAARANGHHGAGKVWGPPRDLHGTSQPQPHQLPGLLDGQDVPMGLVFLAKTNI